MRIINKFGGEIIGNPRLVKLTVFQLKEQLKRNQNPVVVVSALAGVTDKLVKLSQDYDKKIIWELGKQHQDWIELLKVNSQKLRGEIRNLKQGLKKDLGRLKKNKDKLVSQDKILAYGEKWSSLLFTEFLLKNDIRAKRLTEEDLGLITDENFGDANILYEESLRNIKSKLKNISQLPVITGFIGKSRRGQTTTLGRGGSDTTACLLGSVLNPSKVILWKNVPGVLSADPKIVKAPKLVKFLSYEEAEESGKVIHDKSIGLAKEKGIKIEVAHISDPRKKTVITENRGREKGIKTIGLKDNLYLMIVAGEKVDRPGAIAKISKVISGEGVNIALIRNTRDILYIALEKNSSNLAACRKKIEDLNYQVKDKEVAMIIAIGKIDWQMVERFNHLLYEICPRAVLGAFPYQNCLRLEAIVEPENGKKLVRKLHREFIL